MTDTDLARPLAPAAARERTPAGALADVRRLLSPRLLAGRNQFRRLSRPARLRLGGLGLLALAFGAAIFFFFYRTLSYFHSIEEFGPVLTYKLLGMVFVTFFSILLFSNIIAALSTFFLSRELDRLAAAPIPPRRFFYARFAETLIDSSWMMILFSLPAFLAYGVVHHTGPGFYLLTVLTLPPFLVIPAALGIITTAVLVNVFPARRTKDILALLSVVAATLLYVLFRLVRPERLVNPEGFSDFAAFLSAMRTPDAGFLPSTWAVEILAPSLGLRDGHPGFYYLLLASSAGVVVMAAEIVVMRLFLPGWSKAQEGRQARLTLRPAWERLLTVVTAPFPAQSRLLMIKEVKTFFRDTSQWSQLILLLALVVVYVYNFSVLPLKGNALMTFYFKNVIAFLNLALAGFVIASVSVRFVFPSFSLEGRAFWIVKTAPMTLRRLWWAKFWINVVPLLILGEVLVVATNTYLHVMPLMMWLSTTTLFAMILAIVVLGLAVGAAYPRFDADNAAQVAAGVGGLIYMILCMSFIGVVVVLEAWPVYLIFMHRFSATALPISAWLVILCSFGSVIALTIGVFVVSVRRGMAKLEDIEQP